MKVVHLYDGHEQVYEGRGSVPGVVWNVARESAREHEVTVIERQWAGRDAWARHEGVAFERLNLTTGADEPWTRVPYDLVDSPVGLARLVGDRTNFALAALRRLRRLDPDVVHVHLSFAANVLATLVPQWRDRMVFTAHLGELRLDMLDDDVEEEVPGVLAQFSPDVYLAKRAARTTVLNPSIERAFRDRGVPADRLAVVPDGVNVDRFAADGGEARRKRNEYAPPGDGPVVLFVGTLMPRKGVDVLIDALARLNEDRPVRAVIAGEDDLDGAYSAELRERVREAGLKDRVAFPGFVPGEDLPGLYAGADVLAVPSREEGFGMTALEALAAGTPVVATRVGGLPEVIDDGVGELVPVEDSEALAERLGAVLDGAVRAERARERASAYSWRSVAERFDGVYRDVADGNRGDDRYPGTTVR